MFDFFKSTGAVPPLLGMLDPALFNVYTIWALLTFERVVDSNSGRPSNIGRVSCAAPELAFPACN